MNLVADASALIAELLRARGRRLFQRSDLRILVAEEQWAETERGLAEAGTITVVPNTVYADWEPVARRRIRDESDWPVVALALAADAAILTSDPDFLGCGIATWTVETLLAELTHGEGGSSFSLR